MKLTFHTTVTGDCITIETENNLYLVDCGYGPDYEQIVRESGYGGISGLILTHAHADHWGALPQVLPLMTYGHWIAKSGTAFTRELMVQQKPYHKAQKSIDFWNAALAYLSIPAAPIPSFKMDGYTFVDLNADNSGQVITTNEWDHSLIHKGCIVPMIKFHYGEAILGSDLEAPVWESGNWKADAILTRYVLHDFPDQLENWYRRIANMLKTGGRFVNLDVTLSDDPTETWANLDLVIQLANSVQTDDSDEETAKKRFIQHLREEVHRYRPLSDHVQILSLVGLEPEVLARDGNNYLLRAVKR